MSVNWIADTNTNVIANGSRNYNPHTDPHVEINVRGSYVEEVSSLTGLVHLWGCVTHR